MGQVVVWESFSFLGVFVKVVSNLMAVFRLIEKVKTGRMIMAIDRLGGSWGIYFMDYD